MKTRLAAFTAFCDSLYPHETDYLLSVQQFSKPDNLKILSIINHNSKNPDRPISFDPKVDKRTYSYLKNWINEVLQRADVDLFYDRLLELERCVMTDSVTPETEKEFVDLAGTTLPTHYYFIRFFQVMQHYRDYLLVRNRIRYYAQVSNYLMKYHENFIKATDLNHQINSAAEHVIKQISAADSEFIRWEDFFKSIYFDSSLDGYTRYRAAVRLTILYYTNREFEKLNDIYNHLDAVFKTNAFYSKRILANFYHNRAMMHSKLGQLDLAEKYSFLSVRQKNSDYLFYLVSLCDILLRSNKPKQALHLLSLSIPELKNTNSYHSKIGFASLYIKTLLANCQINKAIDYGTLYFESYRREIFQYRWHLFFSSYLQALLMGEKYSKVVSLVKRYRLIAKERELLGTATYLPVILWIYNVSEYIEGSISLETLKNTIETSARSELKNKHKQAKIFELFKIIGFALPEAVKEIKESLKAQLQPF